MVGIRVLVVVIVVIIMVVVIAVVIVICTAVFRRVEGGIVQPIGVVFVHLDGRLLGEGQRTRALMERLESVATEASAERRRFGRGWVRHRRRRRWR